MLVQTITEADMKKRIMRMPALAALLIFLPVILLAGCTGMNTQLAIPEESESSKADKKTDKDSAGDSKKNTAVSTGSIDGTVITFDGDKVKIKGSGAADNGDGTATIIQSGNYFCCGGSDSGRIIIDAGKNDEVTLYLSGLALTSEKNPVIYSDRATKLNIVSVAGTVNDLTYGVSPDSEGDIDAQEEMTKKTCAVFSKGSLTLTGEGVINISASDGRGINTLSDVTAGSGSIFIDSTSDGIRASGSVTVIDALLEIRSGADGIRASGSSDNENSGTVSVEGGTVSIEAELDGIQAGTVLNVSGGELSLVTGGGSANSSTSATGSWGFWGFGNNWDKSSDSENEESAKALKAGTDIRITGGTFTIDSSDDSLHAGGEIVIDGGTFTIASGDDGIHADVALTVNDGTILIEKSYEGLESLAVTVNGGDITINSGDDGINAAGGRDGSSVNGRMGMNMFAATEGAVITVNGGSIYVNSDGDGIDSNGDLYVYGGTIMVDGPTNDGNGALDHNGEAAIYGGTVIASGSSGMIENFGEKSTQNVFLIYFDSAIDAGTRVSVRNAAGDEIIGFAVGKRSSCAIVSSPDIQTGETYTVYVGTDMLCELTADSIITANGSTEPGFGPGFGPGGFGGPGGPGGPIPGDGSFNPGGPGGHKD